MRTILIAALALTVAGGAAEAKDMKSCSADYKTAKAGDALAGQSYLKFMAACMNGGTAIAQTTTTKTPGAPIQTTATTSTPAKAAAPAGAAPSGATAQCKDGSYSMSKHHSGSCSHHGGVAKYL